MTPPTEREAWNSVAAAWRRWWPIFESSAQPLSDALVEQSGARPGMRVLDVGCGIGEPALTVARAVGEHGEVLAIDLAENMIAIARERAAEAGVRNVRFAVADTEALDEPTRFDAALARWSLMLTENPTAAARRVHAHLQPGARFAAAVWAAPSDVPMLAAPRRALAELFDLPPADPRAPGPFRLQDAEELEATLTDAGFAAVTIEARIITMRFANASEYARFVLELSSSLRRALQACNEAAQQRAHATVATAAAPFTCDDGTIVMHNRTWLATATKDDGDKAGS